MRTSRICSCWLLLVPLLGVLGCSSSAYLQKGPEVKTTTVTINACKANPDTVQVSKGDMLTWKVDPSDTHTYSVKFPKHTPIGSSTAPTGVGQNVTGDFWCRVFGGISPSQCVYAYNLIQSGNATPC